MAIRFRETPGLGIGSSSATRHSEAYDTRSCDAFVGGRRARAACPPALSRRRIPTGGRPGSSARRIRAQGRGCTAGALNERRPLVGGVKLARRFSRPVPRQRLTASGGGGVGTRSTNLSSGQNLVLKLLHPMPICPMPRARERYSPGLCGHESHSFRVAVPLMGEILTTHPGDVKS